MQPFFFNRAIVVSLVFVVLGVVLLTVFILNDKKTEVVPIAKNIPRVSDPIKTTIGESVEGRKIDAYIYGNGENHLMFVGGIHGGYEWNSVALAYEILDYIEANPEVVPKNLTVTIIPSANPDGLYRVVGKEGRFTISNVSTDKKVLASGRFNAHNVDLNRNFDCKWKPESFWQNKKVSAGSRVFSEPESDSLKTFILANNPDAVVFWHSQSNAVYASECLEGVLPVTIDIMKVYAEASGYKPIETFDSYETTGDAEAWLASIGIPSITVELKTHETIEFDQNLRGVKALFKYFSAENN